jgi:hypothetical protein
MLYRLFIFLLLTSTYTSFAQKTTFPAYQEIVETLVSTTKNCAVEFNTKLNIEKKAAGYWVGVSTWDDSKFSYVTSQQQLFWSATEQKYNLVTFKVTEGRQTSITQSQIQKPVNRVPEFDPYNMHPFFGYRGWYQDVIKLYSDIEAKRPLEDFELYSLARAYCRHAKISLAAPSEATDGLISDFLTDEASAERIDRYNSIESKGIDYFHQTYLKNPNWKTIIGNIFIKYSNEVVTQYHTLALHTNHEDALSIFKEKELYTKELLAVNTNILNSCPLNAILWTYGDNTSLPMFYLQQVKGIRKDVVVMNKDQLSLWRYIHYATNPKIHSQPILLDIDPAIYKKDNNNYIATRNQAALLDLQDLNLALSAPDKEDRFFGATSIALPFGKDKLNLYFKSNYLMKNEWISLFIFGQNQRPFCFTSDFKINNYDFIENLSLKKHLYPVGLVYQLSKEEYTIASDTESETRYDLITNQLKLIPIKTLSEETGTILYQQLWSMVILANDLYNNDRKGQVIDLLDLSIKSFPMDVIKDYYFLSLFVNLYFKANAPTKAEELIEQQFQILLPKDRLGKSAFRFVKLADNLLQERKIDKFNKTIQQLYLKPNDSPSEE